MPQHKVRKCAECHRLFTTRSPTRWWCDAHKPPPIKPRNPLAA